MANAPKPKKASQQAAKPAKSKKPRKEQVEAEQLVGKLIAKLAEHDPASPVTLRQLAQEAGVAEAGKEGKNSLLALARKQIFQDQAVVPFKNDHDPDLDSPIALQSAEATLLRSGAVLARALDKAAIRAGDRVNRLFSVADVRDTVLVKLRPSFEEILKGDFDDSLLPEEWGWIRDGHEQRRFCRVADLHMRRARPIQMLDFAKAFDETFARLDREGGSYNFVSLVDLRKALPMSREAFDAGLRQLRLARKYTLSAAEGRDGLSPEEQQAGIREARSLLLHVSRIDQ